MNIFTGIKSINNWASVYNTKYDWQRRDFSSPGKQFIVIFSLFNDARII